MSCDSWPDAMRFLAGCDAIPGRITCEYSLFGYIVATTIRLTLVSAFDIILRKLATVNSFLFGKVVGYEAFL